MSTARSTTQLQQRYIYHTWAIHSFGQCLSLELELGRFFYFPFLSKYKKHVKCQCWWTLCLLLSSFSYCLNIQTTTRLHWLNNMKTSVISTQSNPLSPKTTFQDNLCKSFPIKFRLAPQRITHFFTLFISIQKVHWMGRGGGGAIVKEPYMLFQSVINEALFVPEKSFSTLSWS